MAAKWRVDGINGEIIGWRHTAAIINEKAAEKEKAISIIRKKSAGNENQPQHEKSEKHQK